MAEKITGDRRIGIADGRQGMKNDILAKLETKMMDPELSMRDEKYQAYREMVTIIGRMS